jgi:hypothetical protein
MPSGIILKSASPGATEEDLQNVLTKAGYEVDKPAEKEATAVVEEPKRDDFKTEEEFEAAHVEWQDAADAKADEEEEPAEKKEAKPSRKQRAIDRATKELREEVAELRKKLEGKAEPEKKVEARGEEKRPTRGEYADTAEGQQQYEDALLAWGTKKALGDQKVKDAEAANKARFEKNIVNYGAQVEEAKEKYEDWDQVVNQDIFIGRDAQLAILELENGAEVIYYLGRHPVAAAKLGEMSPVSAIMEVGRLATRLKTGTPSPGETNGREAKPKPRIPAPVKHVDTSGSGQTLTFAEIAAKPDYPGKAKDLKRALAR